MHRIGGLLAFLLPLALAPGLFYYYDVTPKVALLLIGAAALCSLAFLEGGSIQSLRLSRAGLWHRQLMLAFAMLVLLAAALSPDARLSWLGSNWRRSGAATVLAILAAAWLTASSAAASRTRLNWLARAICAAGLIPAVYGIVQYFGIDPFLAKHAYETGEGLYQIVRPPSTLGHSDYFAAFLLWPVFAGAGLARIEGKAWRSIGFGAAMLGSAAIVLSGSRAAWLGLALGIVLWTIRHPPSLRIALGGLALTSVALTVFYLSPAGTRMRARLFWIGEDPTGGARLLLWRDSLHMAKSRLWYGFGPETFVAEFPRFESRELARAYPDFYHESPHNMFLDALIEEGMGGALLLAAIAALAITSGWRRAGTDPLALGLTCALGSALLAQQFVVFTIPTAFLFFLGAALLAGLDCTKAPEESKSGWGPLRLICPFAGVTLAGGFLWTAFQIGAGDRALQRMQSTLDAGDGRSAMAAWRSVDEHRGTGVTADIEISRSAALAASKAKDPLRKVSFAQVSQLAARAATGEAEQRANTWYNLAILQAASNDPVSVETSLRSAIASAPRWYKPHWALARLLAAEGKAEIAAREATQALDLDNGKHLEVTSTLATIRSAVVLP